jgi:hypothetical protein
MYKEVWLVICFIVFSFKGYAQYQNPPGLKWQTINSGPFQVVYPDGIKDKASQALSYLTNNYKPVSASLQVKPKPIRLFLFNQTAEANGYFTLAPRHMAWYVNPIPDNSLFSGGDWLQLLATHEFRHVAQFDKAKDGATYLAYAIFGEYGWSFLANISVPYWYWEGDAVKTETELTPIGRGHVPGFEMEIRASVLSGQKISYDQAYLQSFKKHYPSHYHLGYQLVSYVAKKNGDGVWSNILQKSTANSYWVYSFTRSLKKTTGVNIINTFNKMNVDLNEKWSHEQILLPDSSNALVLNATKPRIQTNYTYPTWTSNGCILTLKSGYDEAQQVVNIDTLGNEAKLCHVYTESGITASNNKIIWATQVSDLRWGERSYSCLQEYDIVRHSTRMLTHKTRYYSPSLSPDGKYVAVVENNALMRCNLLIINESTGEIVKTFPSPEDGYIRMPSWGSSGNQIVFTHSTPQGIAVMTVDTATSEFKTLIPHGNVNISHPVLSGEYLYFSASQGSIDIIYSKHLPSGRTYIAFGNKYGSHYASVSPDGQRIAWSGYTPEGYNIYTSDIDTSKWINVDSFCNSSRQLYSVKTEDTVNYVEKKYRPALNLFKFHSWAIYPSNSLNLRLFSDDYLNTSSLSLGANVYSKQQGVRFLGSYTYSGWFPVISVQMSSGTLNEYISETSSNNYYTEKDLTATLGVPLNFSKGNVTSTLELKTSLVSSDITGKINGIDGWTNINNGLTFYTYSQLQLSSHKLKAYRALGPGIGPDISVYYIQTLPQSRYTGKLLSVQTHVALGSFIQNHNASISCGYEDRFENYSLNSYPFSSFLIYPRGYPSYFLKDKYCASFDYELPLFYPDLSIARFCFIKRIRLNGFYDYARSSLISSNNFSSYGVEIKADLNLFRFIQSIDMGMRVSRLQSDGSFAYELLLLGIAL